MRREKERRRIWMRRERERERGGRAEGGREESMKAGLPACKRNTTLTSVYSTDTILYYTPHFLTIVHRAHLFFCLFVVLRQGSLYSSG